MKIKFFGGADEVGRSCIGIDGKLIMDAGIKLGEKIEYPVITEEELKEIKDILITHAHLDHIGFTPHIIEKGFNPRIYSTKPTRDLGAVLLSDYRRISKVFGTKTIEKTMQHFHILEYEESKRINGFDVEFFNAGHILGSAMIRINKKLLYTGDFSMRKSRILSPCKRGIKAETLIVEATYGKKTDRIPSQKESGQRLIEIIKETVLKKGGHVIIPAFGIGRSQEILFLIDDYIRSGVLPKINLWIDGMIGKALRISRHNAYYCNEDIKKMILMSDYDPFKSKNFKRPRTKDRTDVIKEPGVIITTSGMLTGGPILMYLKLLGEDEKNTMIFTGYQGKGTLGRKILDEEREVEIDGERINLKLGIKDIRFSAHSDFNDIVQFIKGIKGLKKIILVHNEGNDLIDALEKKYEIRQARIGEEIEI